MWGLKRPANIPKWIPWNSWCTKVLSSEGFAQCKLVGAPRHNLVGWWGVLWKNEIRGFWDVRVGKAYKCPKMNTIKFLVHESFEFGGFCTWPRLAVHHGIARWLVGEFCEKMKFVIFEMWGLDRATNVPKWIPWNSWCTKVLSSEGLSLGQLGRCIVALPYGLGGVLWKTEIRGFWDVRVEKACKYPQMNTMKFLVHESFEFGGVCTLQACWCTTA